MRTAPSPSNHGPHLRVLSQGEDWVAIDKPAGFVAHRLEDPSHRVPKQFNCMQILRDQLGRHVHPVHRLDRPTSGVLLYALTAERTRAFHALWAARAVQKAYVSLVRGWMNAPQTCERPLASEDGQTQLETRTHFIPIARAEFPRAMGEFATARVSLVWALPETGRFHQIRRHLAGLSHPILGDSVRGDGRYNRFAREMGWQGLLLKAYGLNWPGQDWIRSRWSGAWHSVFEALQACPSSTPPTFPKEEGIKLLA